MKKFLLIMLLAAGVLGCTQNNSHYRIVRKIHIPGNNFWDYLNVDTHGDLFVSHGNMVQVVSTQSGKVIATMDSLDGVHGIALAPNLNKGFISSGRDSVVAVFNLKTFKITNRVKVTGANPDCIVYDRFSNDVFAFDGHSDCITVVSADSEKVVKTIPLAGNPEFAVTDNKGQIYVNIENKSLISLINTKTLTLEKTWPLAPGKNPSGLAADFAHHKLFSVCRNKIMVVFDTQKDTVVDTLPTGGHTDGAGFDPTLQRAYSSNGQGTLTVVQEGDNGNSFKVLEQVPTVAGARTNIVDTITHHIYLTTAKFYPRKKGERWRKMKPGTFEILDVAPNSSK